MNIYIQLLLIATIVCYIVGVSGFTTSWRSWVAKKLHTTESRLKDIKPFDCPSCMAWWVCLIYALIAGQFDLLTISECAALSLMSFPICQLLIFIREGSLKFVDLLMRWL